MSEPVISITGTDGELEARFAPGGGMVCCSLRHRGEELLAQRAGLVAYIERGSTMGIPLLYPWANRLAGEGYGGGAARVELDASSALLRHDQNGLPIHGVIQSRLPWRVIEQSGASLAAELAWTAPELLAVFPYPHTLRVAAHVGPAGLTIETTLTAAGGRGVPVSFGYHPYLALPGSDRRTWLVELPVTRRLRLDGLGIPTGESEAFRREPFALGDSSWDDAFAGLTLSRPFAVSDERRRIGVEFLAGYPFAQVFAPAGEGFICFEPMTAPTNALQSGEGLRTVVAGEVFRTAFRVCARDLR